jgi:F-type H+-transporting ATPase subunit b
MPVSGWTIALQAINFLILVWILNRFLYKPVARMIANRQRQIEYAFAQAAAKEREAEQDQRRYEMLIEGIDGERQRVLADAKASAEEDCRRLVDLARVQADEIKAAMHHESDTERDAIASAASDWAIGTAVTLSTHLLNDLSPSAPLDVFLERILRELRALPADQLADLRSSVAEEADLIVLTAQTLDEVEQRRWQVRLRDELGVDIRLSFRTDPSLIAGVEMRFPHAVIAHSWRETLEAARQDMIDHARSF